MNKEPFDIKNFFFGSIGRRLTFLFLVVGIIAPGIAIYYFYSLSISILIQNPEMFVEQGIILETTAIIIIALIAVDAAIMGFFVSRSITKPIKDLHNATLELEKGNFNIQTKINSSDEIAQLGRAFNQSALALARMDEERKQLDKAKSEFLSMTSHELRTPITPLKAQIQMLQQEFFGTLSKKQKESLNIVLKNTERLNNIIEDFLEISRIEAARLRFVFRKTNVKELVNETVDLMKGFAKERNIELVVELDNLPLVTMDPDRVCQVLRNLIHNAIKFSDTDSKIEISAIQQEGFILFSVKDYGVGMSSEDQIRVFEPFYQIEETLNRKHGGTGLGLAICRGIVESQKGKIWIESKIGKGSTFYFTFPIKPIEEIEPIKILFSQKSEFEKKIKEEFTTVLGPMGKVEFDDLKNKNSINKDDLVEYIDSLKNQKIINEFIAEEFKLNVYNIFGDYYKSSNQNLKNMSTVIEGE